MMMSLWQKTAIFSLLVATFFLTGCSRKTPEILEEERQSYIRQQLASATELTMGGQVDQAIQLLEKLDREHPGEGPVMEAMAFAYVSKPDHTLAAIYFEQSARINPERADLSLYAARSYMESDDFAAAVQSLEAYLALEPEDTLAWRNLAETQQALGHHRDALNAYLQAFRHSPGPPDSRESLEVAKLYMKLNNLAQAEIWLDTALESPARGHAHLGAHLNLLQIHLSRKDWEAAEKQIRAIDALDSRALDKSPLADSRKQLKEWREAQTLLAREQEAIRRQREAEAERIRQNLQTSSDTPPEPDQKAPETTEAGTEAAPEETSEAAPVVAETTPPIAEPTPFDRARELREEGKLADAIHLYRRALAEVPDNPDGWFELSRTYYDRENFTEAEIAASEAMRREPSNVRYTLQFLRSVQRGQPSDRFMRELARAKERFPQSPEVTLALAQGYEMIQQNHRNARILYEEFIRLAPDHPRREFVEERLQRLP